MSENTIESFMRRDLQTHEKENPRNVADAAEQCRLDEEFPSYFPATKNNTQGYRGPSVCQIAGITYRQLDYWARTELITPSIRTAAGSGSQRLYSFKDILVVKIVKRLLDAGISLQNIRIAVEHVRQRGINDLSNITLISDGVTVYELTSPEEVVDLLQNGQGVFGIALSGAVRELQITLADFPAEPIDLHDESKVIADELAHRRRKRERNIG